MPHDYLKYLARLTRLDYARAPRSRNMNDIVSLLGYLVTVGAWPLSYWCRLDG